MPRKPNVAQSLEHKTKCDICCEPGFSYHFGGTLLCRDCEARLDSGTLTWDHIHSAKRGERAANGRDQGRSFPPHDKSLATRKGLAGSGGAAGSS